MTERQDLPCVATAPDLYGPDLSFISSYLLLPSAKPSDRAGLLLYSERRTSFARRPQALPRAHGEPTAPARLLVTTLVACGKRCKTMVMVEESLDSWCC